MTNNDISTVSGVISAPCRHMVGNGTDVGIGFDGDNGTLLIGATLTDLPSTTIGDQGIPFYLGGVKYYLPIISS